MTDKPEYIYITYPVPIDEAGNLPFFNPRTNPPFPLSDCNEENFMPLWFGTARFPEDDTD